MSLRGWWRPKIRVNIGFFSPELQPFYFTVVQLLFLQLRPHKRKLRVQMFRGHEASWILFEDGLFQVKWRVKQKAHIHLEQNKPHQESQERFGGHWSLKKERVMWWIEGGHCVSARLGSGHGKHCVVLLIHMYKSLDVVLVGKEGGQLNVGQLVVYEGGWAPASDPVTSWSICGETWLHSAPLLSNCFCIMLCSLQPPQHAAHTAQDDPFRIYCGRSKHVCNNGAGAATITICCE